MNDWMTLESFRNHSNHSISFKGTSHSTHHPLQRMMGGLTFWKRKLASVRPPCFECFEWWNATRMMGWHWNDGMTMEWAHPRLIHVSSASSHHSSPLILIPEWQDWLLNELWMREWRRNDRHFRIKVNPLDFFWGSSRPIRGLDFELSTNRKPRFWQVHSVSSISITAILSLFRHSTIILSFKSHSIIHKSFCNSTIILSF